MDTSQKSPSRRTTRLPSPTTDRSGGDSFRASGPRLNNASPNNETSRKTILVCWCHKRIEEERGRKGKEETEPPMGFFARRLTTISIVYDFNNLGAALLARLDTFSVVNRATKSVFMGKRRAATRPPSLSFHVLSLRLSFLLRLIAGAETKGKNHRATDRKRSEKRLRGT